MADLTKIADDVYITATEKGFWEEYDKALLLLEEHPDIQKAVKHAYLSQKLMLTVSELGEALEGLRKDKFAEISKFKGLNNADHWYGNFEWLIKNSFEDELADVVIRIFDLAKKLDIDIEWHIQTKMNYNNHRPYKHGRNF